MRIIHSAFFHQGFEAPSTPLNQEEGVLDIYEEGECPLVEESKIAPETLVLRCSLSPIFCENKNINVRRVAEGQALAEAPLYAPDAVSFGYDWEVESSQWQGISLNYVGIGYSIHQGERLSFQGLACAIGQIEMETPLYSKPFRIERENVQERVTTFGDGHALVSPPGLFDARVLRGYGGFYKPGVRLEDIQQIYYALTSTDDQTQVQLFTSSQLQENLTPPPLGGNQTLFFPPPREEEFLSLPGALAAGYARVKLMDGDMEIPLSSFSCESVPGHPNYVNVHFKP